MKNIHILPTEKPSRLWINNLLQGKLELSKKILIGSNTAQNIYITSDEEIKEGDWFLDDNNSIGQSYKLSHVQFANPKKIILTTDFDKQPRVQAIDDEFLEWFVKNPSCKEVEVISFEKYHEFSGDVGYEIIISKEEPKQLFTKGDKVLFTGKMLDEEVIDKVVTVFYTLGRGEVKDMSDIMDEYKHIYRVWNKDLKHIPKEEPKQTVQEYEKQGLEKHFHELKSKQETQGYTCPQTKKQCDDECCVSAEDCHIEASFGIISDCEEIKQKCKDCNDNLTDCTCIEDTIDMKQTAIEKILMKIKSVKLCMMAHPDNELNSEFADRISDLQEIEIELSKQQKRMYSEEDMREAFIAGGNSQIEEDDAYGSEYLAYMEEWFEQFKNK